MLLQSRYMLESSGPPAWPQISSTVPEHWCLARVPTDMELIIWHKQHGSNSIQKMYVSYVTKKPQGDIFAGLVKVSLLIKVSVRTPSDL